MKSINKKKIVIIMTFIVVSAVIAGVLLYIYNSNNKKPSIAEVDGEKVYLDEFYVYLYEQANWFESIGGPDIWDTPFDGESADNIAKQNALNSIANIRTSLKQAQRLGIALDENETKDADEWARQLYDELKIDNTAGLGIDLECLINITRQRELFKKLFDNVTEIYEISEPDFESYFIAYCDQNRKTLERVTVHYLLCVKGERAYENAALIRALAVQGKGLEEILPLLPENLPGVDNIKYGRATANEGLMHTEAVNIAYELMPGAISDIIPTSDGGYYILQVLDIKPPEMEELKALVKEEYTSAKKVDMYWREYERWSADTKVTRNQKLWNEVSVSDLFD